MWEVPRPCVMTFRVGLIPGIASLVLSIVAAQAPLPFEHGILEGLNRLRENPASWVDVLKQQRHWYQSKLLQIPNQRGIVTEEGVRALDEAIAAIESLRGNVGPVVLSRGLSHAAADHVRDM